MTSHWDKNDSVLSSSIRLIAVGVVSSLVTLAAVWIVSGKTDAASGKELTSKLAELERKFDAQSQNHEDLVIRHARLRNELTSLTMENGVIDRMVGHLKSLQQRNAMLSEIVFEKPSNSKVSANGLIMPGLEGAGVTEQNFASPTRLMIVTPSVKPASAPAEPKKIVKADQSDANSNTEGAE
ncbi:hypothetical protein [Brucella thiophenivorans]|nr:hypothetical protein [Brucella thiophenivorans]